MPVSKRNKILGWLTRAAVAVAVLAPGCALAQITYVWGLDSVSGAKCVVGDTSTCQIPTPQVGSSSGGGNTTTAYQLLGTGTFPTITGVGANVTGPALTTVVGGLYNVSLVGTPGAAVTVTESNGIGSLVSTVVYTSATNTAQYCLGAGDTIQASTGSGASGVALRMTGAGSCPGTAIYTTPTAYPTTDSSGTVTAGGSFQTVLALNTSRHGCLIQNPTTATEVLYVYYGSGTPATTTAVSLAAGASFSCAAGGIVPSDLVAVEAATTGHAFIAKSQ